MPASLPEHRDNLAKTGPNETVIFAEPIFTIPSKFRHPLEKEYEYMVPEKSIHWADLVYQRVKNSNDGEVLAGEYKDIVGAFLRNKVPLRPIIAHRDLLDHRAATIMMGLGVRGFSFDPNVNRTSFPRDLMVNLGGTYFISPDANFRPLGSDIKISPLGWGGASLNVGRKLFVVDSRIYADANRTPLERDLKSISRQYSIGRLPYTVDTYIDMITGEKREILENHPDRAAAVLMGSDKKEYLLVEQDYLDENRAPWGSYKEMIEKAVADTKTELVVVPRTPYDVPYSLNFDQFDDGSVVMTSGHPALQEIVSQIVGDEKVVTTLNPVAAYPITRRGGIRCMFVRFPKKMAGSIR